MTLNQRKQLFVHLGELFKLLGQQPVDRLAHAGFSSKVLDGFDKLIAQEKGHNGWFIEHNVRQAFAALGGAMNVSAIEEWLKVYDLPDRQDAPKRVGLILAGNIPMVGFHDVMCVILSGHTAVIKPSRDDNRLLPAVFEYAFREFPELKNAVEWAPMRLEGAVALIATGSGNTAKHFNYYFRDTPRLIRQNRTSIAVLDGTETEEELAALGHDVFDYFGLGCRNVTKLFVPHDFDLNRFFAAVYPFREVINHNKYANNYDYHKALWLLNREELIENGFLLVKEDKALVSPVGSMFVERYSDPEHPRSVIASNRDAIQCVVGHDYLPFGSAQCPELGDYADGVDTLKFLLELH